MVAEAAAKQVKATAKSSIAKDKDAKKDPAEAAHKQHVATREAKDKVEVEKHEAVQAHKKAK